MAPLVNITIVCNSTLAACASALEKVQERYEDAERLSYILGALLGIVFLLFVCSPLIFNLPKDNDNNVETSRALPPPPPPKDDGIEMQDFGAREMPSPQQFIIDEESLHSTQSTLPDPRRYREVEVEGERFHINNSEATLLAETGVFRGAGDERELARHCVENEVRAPPVGAEDEHEGTSSSREDRIGTAV